MDFNAIAREWDKEERIARAKIIAEEIGKEAKLAKQHHVMEFGCGTGLISFNLQQRAQTVTCIDMAPGMVAIVNEKIKQSAVQNMTAYQQDINTAELLEAQYDVIYTSMVLHHIVDIQTTLDNLYTLLKPQGCIVIVDLNEDSGAFHKQEQDFTGHHGFKPHELGAMLAQAGFSSIRDKTFYQGQKAVDGEMIDYSLFIMTAYK